MRAGFALATLCSIACSSGSTPGAGGAGGQGVGGNGAASTTGSGEHGCFATENECGGKCVDIETNAEHCGGCGISCAAGDQLIGECHAGECSSRCAAGFIDDGGACTNFVGTHQAFPDECPGCATENPASGACACPAGSSELALHVQSDCPAVPMRFKTELNLCIGSAIAPTSDFGGAYQIDDLDGWCGAAARCRVGNPLAGDACACPAGFDDSVSIRSIVRLPCDNSEGGTTIVFCGNMTAPPATFSGAYQVDDAAPNCRITNPWTGDCSCPAGHDDRASRIMVDHAAGLIGSRLHLCSPPSPR